jgi:ACS family hexuronate transporter-like MFS transporter
MRSESAEDELPMRLIVCAADSRARWYLRAAFSEIRMAQIKHLRWWIAALLAAATALSYLDRQNFPVVVKEIEKAIPLTNHQFSVLNSLFLLAYGIMYAGGGRIMDWLGTRVGYVLMICWWSAANFLMGTVSSVSGLGVFRFLLGLGEGGGFPGSAKAVAEWFPARERSFAFGIFNTGSSLGAVIAPPLIAGIVSQSNWRWVFFVTGAAGFVWAVVWLRLYELPWKSRFLTLAERTYLGDLGVTVGPPRPANPSTRDVEPAVRWLDLFKYRQVLGLLAAKFLTDSAWYFFIFWLPKYLGDVRHFDIKQIGYYAWIPWVFSGVGSFAGGWLSSHLIRRNLSVDHSRKIALGLSAALMPASLFITASPIQWAIVFFSAAYLGHQFWATILQTLAADLFPSRWVGSVAGLMGAAGAFGGMLFSLIAGDVITRYGYGPVFLIAGVLHPASLVILLLVVRRIEPIALTSSAR